MRKEFCKWILGVILTASLPTAAAHAGISPDNKDQKKDTVRIVVVDKKDGGKSGNRESQRPRPADRN
jgi:hypothetical protein